MNTLLILSLQAVPVLGGIVLYQEYLMRTGDSLDISYAMIWIFIQTFACIKLWMMVL